MQTLLRTVLVAFSLVVATAACAGDVEDGEAAFFRKEYTIALKKYKNVAARNNVYAQLQVGNFHNEGLGVVRDYAEAVRWYKMAAGQGHADAQSNLGFMYEKGRGVVQDYAQSVNWYKLSAAHGQTDAQSNLSFIYSDGKSVVQDYAIGYPMICPCNAL